MDSKFFKELEKVLAVERLDAYRQDGAQPVVALGRYLCNMALCEALYSPLQIAEIALRNSIHANLSVRFRTEKWYDSIPVNWPDLQKEQIAAAKKQLLKDGKPVTPGRMVAELHFGFWTGFFNKSHANTGIGHALARQVFARAPHWARDMKKLETRWDGIRKLRNRVFHHERIIHWLDLDAQHAEILDVTGWINPELREMAVALDRFTAIRSAGLPPWIAKLRRHWPDPAVAGTSPSTGAGIAVVSAVFPAGNGVETPFGHRWGGDLFQLSPELLAALQAQQTLALDVQSEYVVFLQCPATPAATQATATQQNQGGP